MTRQLYTNSDSGKYNWTGCSVSGDTLQILFRSIKVLWRYGRFRFFKMAAVRHLGFLKVQNFNCSCPSEGQNASPCQILCRSVEPLTRYGRLQFFKMAAVRHLGFVICLFGPPTKSILVVCHCAKFGLNRCSGFDNMQVLLF